MTKREKDFILFNFSGICYFFIEMMWRGYSHVTMFFVGGTCFLILSKIFKRMQDYHIVERCIIGALVITIIEFISGCIFNLWLKMKVWDYSNMPFNILGQVCLLYSILWVGISFIIDKILFQNKSFK